MTVPPRSSKQENLDVCVLGADGTLDFPRAASMKLNHGEGPWKVQPETNWMNDLGGIEVGWGWSDGVPSIRILRRGILREGEWLVHGRSHSPSSVCWNQVWRVTSDKRRNMPHNLMFRNFMPQIHTNYTICKVHALSFMEWCDVRQINKFFEEKLMGNGSFQQDLILLFTFISLETERVHAAAWVHRSDHTVLESGLSSHHVLLETELGFSSLAASIITH